MPIKKQTWLERAVSTHNYHARKLKEDRTWTIEDTARSLARSMGAISEDLLIASWLKTHEQKIKEFKYQKDALSFIRDRKKHMMTELTL